MKPVYADCVEDLISVVVKRNMRDELLTDGSRYVTRIRLDNTVTCIVTV
jgi:hypothetical protein